MLIMDGGDLVLVGSSPAVSFRAGTPSTAPSRPLSRTYTASTHGNQDSGRLNKFFEQNGQGRVQCSDAPQKRPESRKQKHVPSYVDDTLFGGKGETHMRSTQWEPGVASKSKTYVFGDDDAGTYSPDTYKAASRPQSGFKRGSYTDRAASPKKIHSSSASHRPVSARQSSKSVQLETKSLKRQPIKFKHTPSYVDDLLFGPKLADPDFPAPWEDHKQTKAFTFDYTNYKTKTQGSKHHGNQYGPPTSQHIPQTASRPPSAGPASRPTTGQKNKHSASFVDDSLFGPKLADPGWKAPWGEKEAPHRQVNIYDAFDHKVTIRHDDVEVVQPRSSVSMQRKKPPSGAKPVWR